MSRWNYFWGFVGVIHDEDENAPPLLSAEGFRVQVENESTYSGRAGDGEFKEMFRVH